MVPKVFVLGPQGFNVPYLGNACFHVFFFYEFKFKLFPVFEMVFQKRNHLIVRNPIQLIYFMHSMAAKPDLIWKSCNSVHQPNEFSNLILIYNGLFDGLSGIGIRLQN